MAKPIKDTPVLKGKDAERFRWHMEHPTPISEERRSEAWRMWKIAKENNPNCDFFR